MTWRSYISTNHGHYNFCLLIAFLLPINKKYVPLVIAFYFLYAIFYSVRKKFFSFNKSNAFLLIPAVLYFLLFAKMGSTLDETAAVKELEIKASMLVFPMLAFMTPRLTRDQVYKIINAFVFGCLIFLVFSVGYGIYRAHLFDSREYLTYSNLGIIYHPTYMALYQCLALSWLLLRGMTSEYFLRNKYVHWIVSFLIIGYIVLLASKAGLLTAIIAIVWAGIVAWRKGVIRRHVFAVSCASLATLIVLINSVPLTSDRIEAAASDISQTQTSGVIVQHEAKSSTELRSVTWSASWELMSKEPIGTGVGSASTRLIEIYQREGEFYAAERKLNSHNQFFQIGVEYGWAGLILFLIFLVLSAIKSFQIKSFMYQGLLGMTVFNFLFESCLEVQAGVVFFYFFLMLFSSVEQNESEKYCI
jgi:hypothetical protein